MIVHLIRHIWLWVEVHTGTVNESGPYYGFFSGFGSDIGEVTILGAAFGLYRAHNCHSKGCPWIGKHAVEGTPYKVCHRCHPTLSGDKATREEIHAAHREANQ